MNSLDSKISEIQPYLKELEADGVVFLNVTLDENKEVLDKILASKQFKGTHIMAKGSIESTITRSYEVRVLPQYFIIQNTLLNVILAAVKGSKAYDISG